MLISISALALVAANLVPLLGILIAGWNLKTLALVYCIENGVVGLYALAKVILASERSVLGKSTGYQAIFFVTHYSTWCVMYGAVLMTLAFPAGASYGGVLALVPIPILIFIASHGVSFKFNYWDGKQFARVTSFRQMFLPYVRVGPWNVVVAIGVVVFGRIEEFALAAPIVLAMKTLADVGSHALVHRDVMRQAIPGEPEPTE